MNDLALSSSNNFHFSDLALRYDAMERGAYQAELKELSDRSPSCRLRQVLEKMKDYPGSTAEKLIDLFGGMDHFQLKELVWQERFLGVIPVLSEIKHTDMSDSIMWGIDPYGRLYIAFKIKIINSGDHPEPAVFAIRQKYREWGCFWIVENNDTLLMKNRGPVYLLGSHHSLEKKDLDILQKLIQGDSIEVTSKWHEPAFVTLV